jgi:hypothetical protein
MADVAKGLDSKGSELINKYSLSKTADCGTKGSDEKNSSNKYSLANQSKGKK